MKEFRAIASIIALLLLAPFIGIAASIASLLFFFAFPIWIAWRVFVEREPGLCRFGKMGVVHEDH